MSAKTAELGKRLKDESTARDWLEHVDRYGAEHAKRIPANLLPIVRQMKREQLEGRA